jgi:hypothetical protein
MRFIYLFLMAMSVLLLLSAGHVLLMGSTFEVSDPGPNDSMLAEVEEGTKSIPNSSTESEMDRIQHMFNNKSITTLDLMQALLEQPQKTGILDRMAQCGATMHNMTEEQYECVNDLAAGFK